MKTKMLWSLYLKTVAVLVHKFYRRYGQIKAEFLVLYLEICYFQWLKDFLREVKKKDVINH